MVVDPTANLRVCGLCFRDLAAASSESRYGSDQQRLYGVIDCRSSAPNFGRGASSLSSVLSMIVGLMIRLIPKSSLCDLTLTCIQQLSQQLELCASPRHCQRAVRH